MRQWRRLTAELPAIIRSPATAEKPVCSERKRSSQPGFTPADAPGARRFRLPSSLFGGTRVPSKIKGEYVARAALPERRPEDRAALTIACDRRRYPVLRLPAVVRRPGPRRVLGSRIQPSVFICVICGFSGLVGDLGALGVLVVKPGKVLFRRIVEGASAGGSGAGGAAEAVAAGDDSPALEKSRIEVRDSR